MAEADNFNNQFQDKAAEVGNFGLSPSNQWGPRFRADLEDNDVDQLVAHLGEFNQNYNLIGGAWGADGHLDLFNRADGILRDVYGEDSEMRGRFGYYALLGAGATQLSAEQREAFLSDTGLPSSAQTLVQAYAQLHGDARQEVLGQLTKNGFVPFRGGLELEDYWRPAVLNFLSDRIAEAGRGLDEDAALRARTREAREIRRELRAAGLYDETISQLLSHARDEVVFGDFLDAEPGEEVAAAPSNTGVPADMRDVANSFAEAGDRLYTAENALVAAGVNRQELTNYRMALRNNASAPVPAALQSADTTLLGTFRDAALATTSAGNNLEQGLQAGHSWTAAESAALRNQLWNGVVAAAGENNAVADPARARNVVEQASQAPATDEHGADRPARPARSGGSNDVAQMQAYLTLLGKNEARLSNGNVNVDGLYGRLTRDALQNSGIPGVTALDVNRDGSFRADAAQVQANNVALEAALRAAIARDPSCVSNVLNGLEANNPAHRRILETLAGTIGGHLGATVNISVDGDLSNDLPQIQLLANKLKESGAIQSGNALETIDNAQEAVQLLTLATRGSTPTR